MIQNNYCVSNGSGFSGPSGAVVDHNVVRTKAQADADGMTASQSPFAFYPKASAATIGAGANLGSRCSGILARLCSDTSYGEARTGLARPSTGTWDVGAYSYR
jgi:hypothetical protein